MLVRGRLSSQNRAREPSNLCLFGHSGVQQEIPMFIGKSWSNFTGERQPRTWESKAPHNA